MRYIHLTISSYQLLILTKDNLAKGSLLAKMEYSAEIILHSRMSAMTKSDFGEMSPVRVTKLMCCAQRGVTMVTELA